MLQKTGRLRGSRELCLNTPCGRGVSGLFQSVLHEEYVFELCVLKEGFF